MSNLDKIAYLEKQYLGANPSAETCKQATTMHEVHKAHIHAGIRDADQRYINALAEANLSKHEGKIL